MICYVMNFVCYKYSGKKMYEQTVHDEASARALLSTYWAVNPSSIKISPLTGGITNKLLHATYRDQHVLVRILGAAGSLLIDRAREARVVAEISAYGFGPEILFSFANGRVEEFFSAHRPLLVRELLDPEISSQVAASLARLHGLPVKSAQSETPEIFSDLSRWLEISVRLGVGEFLASEVDWLQAALRAVVARPKKTFFAEKICQTVFCHNDLLAGNILISQRKLIFIDFEYSAYNVAAFDLANHFAAIPESALIATGLYGSLPDVSFRKTFIANYFHTTDPELDEALDVVNFFHLAAELRWVLWALVQAAVSQEIFDYTNYAHQRLHRGYFAHKAVLVQGDVCSF